MKPKQREAIISEFKLLQNLLQQHGTTVKVLFPDIVPQIKEIYNEVLYDKVDQKDRGLLLNPEKKRNILGLVHTIEDVKTAFIKELTNSENDKIVLTDVIKNSALATEFTTDALFKDLEVAVQAVINNVSGTFVNKKDLQKKLIEAINNTYADIDAGKIEKCKNIKSIKNLGVGIIDEYLDGYKSTYKGNITKPNYDAFINEMNTIFDEYAVLSQAEFESQVQKWFAEAAENLASLEKDKFAQAPVILSEAAAKLQQQTSRFVEDGLEVVGQAVVDCLAAIEDGLSLAEVAKTLASDLPSIQIPQLGPDQLGEISQEANYVTRTLSTTIVFGDALLAAINPNAPIFVINQPRFREDLMANLNEWKEELTNSLTEAADLILKLDGCTIDGALFITNISDCCKVDAVHKAISGLAFEEMKLLRHKDLAEFEAQWGKPWTAAIQGINVESDIIDVFANDPDKLVELYTDIYTFVPSADHVIATLNLCIGGKVNLALQAVNRLKKEVDKISEEVTIIKNVNDMQTLGLGYNSMSSEVDLIFKNIVQAHKIRHNKIALYCLEYDKAHLQADASIEDFNKASDALKAFREAIFDALKGIATAALCATGVGALAGAAGSLATFAASEMAKAVLEATVEAAIEGAVDVVIEGIGAKEAVCGGLPTLKNFAPSTLVTYLKQQIEGEDEIIAVLHDLIKVSEGIQKAKSYIQHALDNKINMDISPLVAKYDAFAEKLSKWLGVQKANINTYNEESEKLTIQANITCKNIERNMYVQIIADQFKGDLENGDNWQLLCDSHKVFRPRLLATGMIRSTDFIDNMGYDYEWQAELKYLYDQKEIAVF